MGVSVVLIPHDFWICLIICLSPTHSRVTSYSAINSYCFLDIATKVFLHDLHEIPLPLERNTNLVCDFAVPGSNRYPASA